ncbi:hypothetical protein C2G38_1222226 [Gigaspora rosea]|uniref:Receptor L-domain domain-containing protein n=1 Tax=Gigaspora rosea TaxID=44941 RepID=A0A397VC71_9GLOM|nr:hypothetical protein C2G38_1222226 [Gigaspora rosea]
MKNIFLILNLLLFSLILQSHLTACGLYEPLAQYLNVSESEVPELLSNQKILIEGNRNLIPLLNSTIFGGSYIDIKANKLNINIVDMSQQGIITNNPAMKPYLKLLSFVQVKNSFDQLNFTFNQLNILEKNTMQSTTQ